ncbi:MAG: hypothetical protein GX362_00475 [Methanosarcinaceae archaeon]|nr:hypothetical protein [Methanosarcinaceae archaeon]
MYYVWVCPKCKSHSQITYITRADQKTTGCQNCKKRIDIRKIRILGSFDDRNDAVTLRSALHAQVTGPLGSIESGEIFKEIIKENMEKNEKQMNAPKVPKKASPDKIIENIIKKNGKTSLDQIVKCCMEEGIEKEKTVQMISKMLYAGIIYEPSKKVYDIVK